MRRVAALEQANTSQPPCRAVQLEESLQVAASEAMELRCRATALKVELEQRRLAADDATQQSNELQEHLLKVQAELGGERARAATVEVELQWSQDAAEELQRSLDTTKAACKQLESAHRALMEEAEEELRSLRDEQGEEQGRAQPTQHAEQLAARMTDVAAREVEMREWEADQSSHQMQEAAAMEELRRKEAELQRLRQQVGGAAAAVPGETAPLAPLAPPAPRAWTQRDEDRADKTSFAGWVAAELLRSRCRCPRP